MLFNTHQTKYEKKNFKTNNHKNKQQHRKKNLCVHSTYIFVQRNAENISGHICSCIQN